MSELRLQLTNTFQTHFFLIHQLEKVTRTALHHLIGPFYLYAYEIAENNLINFVILQGIPEIQPNNSVIWHAPTHIHIQDATSSIIELPKLPLLDLSEMIVEYPLPGTSPYLKAVAKTPQRTNLTSVRLSLNSAHCTLYVTHEIARSPFVQPHYQIKTDLYNIGFSIRYTQWQCVEDNLVITLSAHEQMHRTPAHWVKSATMLKHDIDKSFSELFTSNVVTPWEKRALTSIKKQETSGPIAGYIEQLRKEKPLLGHFLNVLHSDKASDRVTNNQLLSKFYAAVSSYEQFEQNLQKAYSHWLTLTSPFLEMKTLRDALYQLDGVSEHITDKRAKTQWQFAKSNQAKAETLGITETKYPHLFAALVSGDIPFALFHVSGCEDKLINVEYPILEHALAIPQWHKVVCEIAQNASRRNTYSRRITNYLSFILYTLPNYLNRNAPLKNKGKKKRSWTCIPKFVNSQWELEMSEDSNENGTTKRRSALTPVADNDTGVVTVPYAAMSISGVRTTWCYSELYTVVEQGQEDPLNDNGGVFPSDLAEKLNGRDDYGLCFYTLTGTARNQGYPTFLIIFERTSAHGTKVHFHRVHPSRYRGPAKTATPSSVLIEECYRYMAGNVRAEEIAYQQGDLLLLRVDQPGKVTDTPVNVFGFENHEFKSKSATPVKLLRATGKSRGNTLGWLHAPDGMSMPHPEHEPIEDIKPGWYELKRCKSYENNPVSVWVLNID